MPAISVIIPVLNGEKTIGEQLRALAAQEFEEPWEVIVSDNGSTDGTRDVVLEARESFPVPIRIVDSGARPGVSYARNVGILAARSDRIAICDSDDRVGACWLRGAFEGLDRFDVVGGPLRPYLTPFDPEAPALPYSSVGEEGIMGGHIAMRRPVILDVGGFDANFTGYGREDYEFSVRLWKARASMGLDQRFELYYRLSGSTREFIQKVYRSCVVDVSVWRRHPSFFPGRQGRGYVVREAVALPVNMVRAFRGGGTRRVGRVLVSFAAHARTMLPPQSPLPEPFLIDKIGEVHEVEPKSSRCSR